MSDDLTIDDLLRQIDPLKGYVGRKIQHVRTSGWYRITGIHFSEADMTVVASYETLHAHPISFTRPIAEMLDGRFRIGAAA